MLLVNTKGRDQTVYICEGDRAFFFLKQSLREHSPDIASLRCPVKPVF